MPGVWIKKLHTDYVIVFIHGIISSEEKCWTAENGAFWPNIVSDDIDLSEFSVYSYSYNTGIYSGSFGIYDIVDDLEVSLRLDGVINRGNIVFVAHSMGG